MELPTINYELALEKDKIIGLLSKNFRNKDKYYKLACKLSRLDLFRFNYYLSKFSEDKEIHKKLCRLLIKDFYTCLRDREINVLCEKGMCSLDLAPCFDFERAFNEESFENNYCNPLFKDILKRKHKSITLDTLSAMLEYDDYLREQLDKMLEFDMVRALDNIRDKHKINIPPEVELYYLQFNECRKELLSRKLKKVG